MKSILLVFGFISFAWAQSQSVVHVPSEKDSGQRTFDFAPAPQEYLGGTEKPYQGGDLSLFTFYDVSGNAYTISLKTMALEDYISPIYLEPFASRTFSPLSRSSMGFEITIPLDGR